MGLNEEVKWQKIHSKFKELVKKYHPDKNHGNKEFEEKLKKITLAYSQLKKTLGKKMSSEQLSKKPDIKLSVKQTFGFDSEMKVGAFSKKINTFQK